MGNSYRLCLGDNLVLLRSALVSFLNEKQNLAVVGEASNGRELLHLVERQKPDLILLELLLPIISGLEVIRTLRQQGSPVKILVLTELTALESMRAAFAAGAQGYVTKHASLDECSRAIETVLAGQPYYPEIFGLDPANLALAS